MNKERSVFIPGNAVPDDDDLVALVFVVCVTQVAFVKGIVKAFAVFVSNFAKHICCIPNEKDGTAPVPSHPLIARKTNVRCAAAQSQPFPV